MRRALILMLAVALCVGPTAGGALGARAGVGKSLADQVGKFYKSAVVAVGSAQSCGKMGKSLQAWTARNKGPVAALVVKIKRMGAADKIAYVTEYGEAVGANQGLLESLTTMCSTSKQVKAALILLGTVPHE
jgi:hypothetical protein